MQLQFTSQPITRLSQELPELSHLREDELAGDSTFNAACKSFAQAQVQLKHRVIALLGHYQIAGLTFQGRILIGSGLELMGGVGGEVEADSAQDGARVRASSGSMAQTAFIQAWSLTPRLQTRLRAPRC